MKKILGLTTSSFKILREQDNLYVDKTKWIHYLVTREKAYFLSRPRRFGKSLTISTLKHLFRGNKDLFKGLFIEDKWDFKPYPVLCFDFNETGNRNSQYLEKSLKNRIFQFSKDYNVDLSKD